MLCTTFFKKLSVYGGTNLHQGAPPPGPPLGDSRPQTPGIGGGEVDLQRLLGGLDATVTPKPPNPGAGVEKSPFEIAAKRLEIDHISMGI